MSQSITLSIVQKNLTVPLDSWNARTAHTTCLIHPESLTMRADKTDPRFVWSHRVFLLLRCTSGLINFGR